MVVGISIFELHIPASRGLKQKRQVVHSLVERLHQRHRLSILESGLHELHQRAEIGFALVAASEGDLQRRLESIRRLIEEHPGCQLLFWEPEILSAHG